MDQSDQETALQREGELRLTITQERRLSDFVGRFLLVVNLLVLIFLCVAIVPGIGAYRNVFGGMNKLLPVSTQLIITAPVMMLWGIAAGLGMGLIILEVVVRNRKSKIICNAVALILFVGVSLYVEAMLLLPIANVMMRVQKN
jgi:hypothetical protein